MLNLTSLGVWLCMSAFYMALANWMLAKDLNQDRGLNSACMFFSQGIAAFVTMWILH